MAFDKQTSGAARLGIEIQWPELPEEISKLDGAIGWYYQLRKNVDAALSGLATDVQTRIDNLPTT